MRAVICIFLVLSDFTLAADDFSPEMDPDKIDIVDVMVRDLNRCAVCSVS
jgi:hypothetical protein